MFPPVDTRNPAAVRRACMECLASGSVPFDAELLERAFTWIERAFAGLEPDYEKLDAAYHDLEHTMQGALCMARILAGWQRWHGTPPLDTRAVQLGMLAILFHDTGYLKPHGDHSGTGAKFTRIHVQRSTRVAARWLAAEDFAEGDIHAVQSMIRCTAVNARLDAIAFDGELDRRVGYAVASADLLGQMAASDYLEKLPHLQSEFAEAAEAESRPPKARVFCNSGELIERTPGFWKEHVLPLLDGPLAGVHRHLAEGPGDSHEYVARIEANLARIHPATRAVARDHH